MAAFINILLLIAGLFAFSRCQLELDERFLEYKDEGMWLIEFYAPWCGHCKKLEPVFRDVARELQRLDSQVHVGKIDCTRFTSLASEFSVRGFPTIMFIHGDRKFTHRGDRTKEDILEFALRAQGPTVRKLTSPGKFNEAYSRHNDVVFFLYVGDDDENEDLYRKYLYAAETHAVQAYYYYGKKHIIENRPTKRDPSLLVFKDGQYYEYIPAEDDDSWTSVERWINRERFAEFPLMTGPAINEMVDAAKFLVIMASEADQLDDPGSLSSRFEIGTGIYSACEENL